MPRSTFTVPYKTDFKTLQGQVEYILKMEGFASKDYHGEQVWKNGTGMLTAMKYIKVEYGEGSVTISAWVQTGVGNVGGKEMALEGFVGIIPKRSLKKVVDRLRDKIQSL